MSCSYFQFSFMVYCVKSYLENRSEKNHEYDMEKLRVENDNTCTQEDPEEKVFTEDEINPYSSGDVSPISNEYYCNTDISTNN